MHNHNHNRLKFNTLRQKKRSDDYTQYHGVVGPVRSGDGK